MFSFTFYSITETLLWLAEKQWKYCKYRFNSPFCLLSFSGGVGVFGLGACLGFFLNWFIIKSIAMQYLIFVKELLNLWTVTNCMAINLRYAEIQDACRATTPLFAVYRLGYLNKTSGIYVFSCSHLRTRPVNIPEIYMEKKKVVALIWETPRHY